MKVITALAVIASIVFVGWTRNRLVKYEQSLEALETEGLVVDDPQEHDIADIDIDMDIPVEVDVDIPVEVDIDLQPKDERRE
jgi:hypothetical protein